MQRSQRLTGQKNFSNIRKNGRGVTNQLLVLRIYSNGLDTSRFAFLASKRIGNAVTRNRLKRRLREVVRSTKVKIGSDVLFIARRGSGDASFPHLREAAMTLLRRARLLEGVSDSPREEGPATLPAPARPQDGPHLPATAQGIGTAQR